MSSDSTYLEDLINQENSKIKKVVPSEAGAQKMLLHNLIRVMDIFFNFVYEEDSEEVSIFYELGYNKALSFIIDSFVNSPGWVKNPINKQLWNWTNSFITHCGRIALAERILLYEKAGISKIVYEKRKKVFYISYISPTLDIERFDRKAGKNGQNDHLRSEQKDHPLAGAN